jgi:hypothetical protein
VGLHDPVAVVAQWQLVDLLDARHDRSTAAVFSPHDLDLVGQPLRARRQALLPTTSWPRSGAILTRP